jgi:hypothetical protein
MKKSMLNTKLRDWAFLKTAKQMNPGSGFRKLKQVKN